MANKKCSKETKTTKVTKKKKTPVNPSCLRPAILYKDEIMKEVHKKFYTKDMFYMSGAIGHNWIPNIGGNDNSYDRDSDYKFAVVNRKDKLVGLIEFSVDWYASCAYNFGLMGFNKGNILIAKGLDEVITMIRDEFKIHRMEYKMVGGNPVEKHYDRFCERYNGQKVVMHDVIKDQQGNYINEMIYEIIFDN